MKLIDKEKVVEEIKELYNDIDKCISELIEARSKHDGNGISNAHWRMETLMVNAQQAICNVIDTFETEDAKIWHRQSEKDIYDSFNDWSYHTFLCLMDDGSVQKFSGICDEYVDGTVNKHIDAIDDKYDDVNKIVYWIETPITLK